MARRSLIEKNKRRIKMTLQYSKKRQGLKDIVYNKESTMEERFGAQLKLAKLPRNSTKVRIRNRCELTGRPRGFYQKFKLSRIALRDLAAIGQIPGMIKASW